MVARARFGRQLNPAALFRSPAPYQGLLRQRSCTLPRHFTYFPGSFSNLDRQASQQKYLVRPW